MRCLRRLVCGGIIPPASHPSSPEFNSGELGCDAKSRPQATDRQSLRAGIALDVGKAITSSALMPHTLPFLCISQKSLLFVLAGQFSVQVIRALIPLKTANLTLTQQIEYRTYEAVADLVPPDFTYRGQTKTIKLRRIKSI